MDLSIDQQIEKLNEEVRCTLKPSPIHGIGVFALRDIKEGERLYCRPEELRMYSIPYERLTELRPEIRQIILERWPNVINGMQFVAPDALLSSFMNHSPWPNCREDRATRDILANEEITEDYSTMERAKEIFPWL